MAEPQHVIDARAQVARLSRSFSKAPQSEVDSANARYVVAKIDSDIRKTVQRSLKGARLDDTQVAHLVGLVLALGGVKYEAAEQIEQVVRSEVLGAQQGGQS